jgi:hypothetical protein
MDLLGHLYKYHFHLYIISSRQTIPHVIYCYLNMFHVNVFVLELSLCDILH